MLVYKMVADSVEEPIPETHVVMYQLAVTGSTIGNVYLMQGMETSLRNLNFK